MLVLKKYSKGIKFHLVKPGATLTYRLITLVTLEIHPTINIHSQDNIFLSTQNKISVAKTVTALATESCTALSDFKVEVEVAVSA